VKMILPNFLHQHMCLPSISSTFYERVFQTKVLRAAFL
jgi:hypothetical protein